MPRIINILDTIFIIISGTSFSSKKNNAHEGSNDSADVEESLMIVEEQPENQVKRNLEISQQTEASTVSEEIEELLNYRIFSSNELNTRSSRLIGRLQCSAENAWDDFHRLLIEHSVYQKDALNILVTLLFVTLLFW